MTITVTTIVTGTVTIGIDFAITIAVNAIAISVTFLSIGNFSTGFRAPTPGQSNYTGVVTSFDGVTGTQINEGTLKPTDPLSLALGGAALVPEESQNVSVG